MVEVEKETSVDQADEIVPALLMRLYLFRLGRGGSVDPEHLTGVVETSHKGLWTASLFSNVFSYINPILADAIPDGDAVHAQQFGGPGLVSIGFFQSLQQCLFLSTVLNIPQ